MGAEAEKKDFGEVMPKCVPFVHRLAREVNAVLPRIEVEDAEQEIWERLILAYKRYNPSSSVPEEAYLLACAKRAKSAILRRENRACRKPLHEPLSLEKSMVMQDGTELSLHEIISSGTEDPVADAVCAKELCDFIVEYIKNLPDKRQQMVIVCCLMHKTQMETAKQTGFSQASVSWHLAKFRQALNHACDTGRILITR